MKKLQRFLAILTFFLPLSPAIAIKMSNLYQTEILVPSQAYDLREQAVKEGLLQVLTKISGNAEIGKNPIIKLGLKKADYYVQEYNYSSDSRDASQYQLKISYEPNDINRLLAKAKVAHWSENRPLILVWLVVITPQRMTNIISNELGSFIFAKMMQKSKQDGLPLIFPVMDVTDLNLVSAEDIMAMNIEVLQRAAKRYAPEGLLIGQIKEYDHRFQSKWQLNMKDEQWDWTITYGTTDETIAYVMNQVSQAITQYHRTKTIANNKNWLGIKIEVGQISKPNDLERLMQYFKQVKNVRTVQLTQVKGDTVKLSIEVPDSLAVFEQHILANDYLRLTSEDQVNNKLIYKWIK